MDDGHTGPKPSQAEAGGKQGGGVGIFTTLVNIYEQALVLDQDDVEANFNLAGLYLQRKEQELALKYYQNSIKKDEAHENLEVKALFA